MRPVIVVDYDPAWPDIFEDLRARVWDVVGDFALAVEHVGSTSVPGLAAKPIIDVTVVVQSINDVPRAIERLGKLGYIHRGNLGIEGRESFQTPAGLPDHHLYVCAAGNLALINHLALRDYLRANPEAVQAYSELKKSLALKFRDDIDGYIDGKTDFILGILREMGLSADQLENIERVNRKSYLMRNHQKSMSKPKLLVLDDYEGELANALALARLRQLAEVEILDRPINSDNYAKLNDIQILLALRERTALDAHFFATCPALELVLQTGGHAYHIDQEAATQQGIVIALGRRVSGPAIAVPELVFGFMLGLLRQVYPLTTAMHNGGWPEAIGGTLSGRTLGILGFGRLGRPVARLAEAFGMKVVAWGRSGISPGSDSSGVVRLPLDDLLAVSDVVTIHLRLSDQTRGLLNRERLWKMKPGAILINTSRGAIVDEPALIEALREKRLAGAGLDVFGKEPLPEDSELRSMPNVILTPHIGWKVREVLHEFVEIAADQLDAWLNTGLPRSEVLNPEAMDVIRTRSGTLRL